jgi:hypothetical protein
MPPSHSVSSVATNAGSNSRGSSATARRQAHGLRRGPTGGRGRVLDDFEDALGAMRAGEGLKIQVLPNG